MKGENTYESNSREIKLFHHLNFNLGVELHIAGIFIYDGLKSFDCMENFYYDDEIFEFLYNISVGIERLEKIAIILMEHKHNKTIDQDCFEKKLRIHLHTKLLQRISEEYNINIGLKGTHEEFIQLLTTFYKEFRYIRYNLKDVPLLSCYNDDERVKLVAYIEKHLKVKIKYNGTHSLTTNDSKIKIFMGKIIGEICSKLYDVILDEASDLNIYTYEIRPYSKAFKIFMRKEYDFLKEDVVWKEILIYLLNNTKAYKESAMLSCIKDIEPLNFEDATIQGYIMCFKSELEKTEFIDEVYTLYSKYLFSWDDIPGKDSNRLLKFLRDDLKIEWAENAKIEKSGDGKVKTVTKDENSLELKLNEKENKVTLKISGGKTYEYILKEENGKLNIYYSKIDEVKRLEIISIIDDPKIQWDIPNEEDNYDYESEQIE